MDKSLGQLLTGAVLGAVAVEVLRAKKPEVLDEITSNAKGIAINIKNIYKQLNTTVRDWAQNPS
jgi:hypothetical protein